jgi:hypothetical protein
MTELRSAAEKANIAEGVRRALDARRRINRLVHGIDTDQLISTRADVEALLADKAA